MSRTLILGGGIVGLSIAFELASRGDDVRVIENGEFGKKASWAGAGMLPPINAHTAIHPLEHLAALSNQRHREWSTRLKQLTGIDNDYRINGSLYLAQTPGEIASLFGAVDEWDTQQIEFEQLAHDQLRKRFKFLGDTLASAKSKSVLTPSAAQFDNRRHLDALVAACRRQAVTLKDQTKVCKFVTNDQEQTRGNQRRVSEVHTVGADESIHWEPVDHVVIAAGPWSESLVEQLDQSLPMQPVRGQMVGYHVCPETQKELVNGPIINEGTRYLVARSNGYIVAGSTIEETGFDCVTTEEEITELRTWTERTVPCLNETNFVEAWAGLRPATYDGFPYIGRLPSFENVWVATGHFKSGLQLSTGTAVTIADLILGEEPSVDLSPFDPGRVK